MVPPDKDADAYPNRDTGAVRDTDGHPHADTDRDTDGDIDTYTNVDTFANIHGYGHSHEYPNSGYRDRNVDAHAAPVYCDRDCHAHCDTD